ncbi:TRAP transporter substrate-binding protein [Xanthobacter tagetidis]|uniref:DctP family TRAP transporter solute-binding subunit n=1 Tax=Xanthobacter tagetidis TaxID=60216 RepID=A0A3L6ZZJ5_9HYPH|nr:TRAP transporter substrate-binding protein [Xanthobacter tagetidis]MBB6310228.1 tripartite ATP-independent transporter DctP family solute receptor [Xanthobacter tagetidis]RLP72811.1 DctP family TRAP transporter solute-binding subunit [Xanthobacter tagetidis]
MKTWMIAAALLLGAAAPASAQTTLKYTFVNPMNSHFGAAATAFKETVEKESGGKIKVDIFPGGALGGEREIVESLQLGTIDMAMTSTSVVANFVPELLVFDIPFIFRDTAHARAVVDGQIGQDILAKVKDKGVIGLGYGENGFRHLTNNKRAVETPADLSGLTIRTMENPIHITAFKELGARPTPIAWPELYAALQQGVVDGEENPLSNILTAKLYQVQKYLTLTGHVYAPTLVMISPAAWNKLTPDQQKILKDAVAKAIVAQRKAVEELEANAVKTLKDQGMQVEAKVDNAQFSAKLAPAYAQFSKQFGQKTLDAIRDTK